MKNFIVKNSGNIVLPRGWFSAYIIIEKDHPWYGLSINEIPAEVHGGITIAENITEEHEENSIMIQKSDIGKFIIGWDTMRIKDTPKRWSKEKVRAENKKLLYQCEQAITNHNG